ncbi:MAG: SsrA-binding protein SmpB [Acidimicrobiales bacterium]
MTPTKTKRKQLQSAVDGKRLIASNKKARHDYDFLEVIECGIALRGSEVKSLREARVQLRDSYARIDGGEVWLFGVHISPYEMAGAYGALDPMRVRKLLLHRTQIDKLRNQLQLQKLTLVPVSMYFRSGRVKVELALAKGRHTYDKRRELAKRDAELEVRRVAKNLGVRIS